MYVKKICKNSFSPSLNAPGKVLCNGYTDISSHKSVLFISIMIQHTLSLSNLRNRFY